MLIFIIELIAGMALLYFGGDWLVDAASHLAKNLGVKPLVIGLTIVAFGTSCPELLVSTISALNGQDSVALGNVVGSNITNIALVLGLVALLKPIPIEKTLLTKEYLITLIVAFILLACCLDFQVSRLDGALLTLGVVIFTFWAIWDAKKNKAPLPKEVAELAADTPETAADASAAGAGKELAKDILFLLLGFGAVVGGAKLLVVGATGIARALGVSELVIGLTMVALGTSLPELSTSVIGIIKGEDEIAVGNILGSNIFNILAVMGISSAIRPVGVEKVAFYRDIPIMIGVTVLLGLLMRPGYKLSRWRGGLLLALYATYTVYIYLPH